MKVQNIQEFKNLISTAKHRERFVFDIPKEKPYYHYTQCCCLEVYITHLRGTIENPVIRSVLYSTVDIEGKFDKKWNRKRSCQVHCTSEKDWQAFYSFIN